MLIASLFASTALALSPEQEPELPPLLRLNEFLPQASERDRARTGNASDFVQSSVSDTLLTTPVVSLYAREDMRMISLSVAFSWAWLGQGEARSPVWFARLRSAQGRQMIERFADARDCPGIAQSLQQISELPAVTPIVRTPPDPGGPAVVTFHGYLHDNTYIVRMKGRHASGHYSDEIAMTGGSGSPFPPIFADTLERLRPCWTETPPSAS